MTSGLSGDPKFRQFVSAIGLAPVTMRFLHASAITSRAPAFGSVAQYLAFESRVIARDLRFSFIRMTAASEPHHHRVRANSVVVLSVDPFLRCNRRRPDQTQESSIELLRRG